MVTQDNFKEIYWENNNNELVPAENYNFRFDKLTRAKWFKREVIKQIKHEQICYFNLKENWKQAEGNCTSNDTLR
ncbi:hypothetical protein BAQ48_16905 [Bacillus luti]|uniref:hypothetical protein n=1 Tax=Bacillus luti TaxID=2026191 RepID=UPI0008FE9597|nr:hypothetical protein [Bacillus luti]OJE49564.1 hypothetical protein BAQ48_16905 [Bacillus luti]